MIKLNKKIYLSFLLSFFTYLNENIFLLNIIRIYRILVYHIEVDIIFSTFDGEWILSLLEFFLLLISFFILRIIMVKMFYIK